MAVIKRMKKAEVKKTFLLIVDSTTSVDFDSLLITNSPLIGPVPGPTQNNV